MRNPTIRNPNPTTRKKSEKNLIIRKFLREEESSNPIIRKNMKNYY